MSDVECEAVVAELVERVDELFGLYLDAVAGFGRNVEELEEVQRKTQDSMPGQDLDASPFYFGKGDPNDDSAVLQHSTTQGEFKRRNRRGGRNEILMFQFLIVLLYELWETGYRNRLAEALGIDRDKLLIPIFGDLRLLRHEVLHNKGTVSEKTSERLEVIKAPPGWLHADSEEKPDEIIRAIKAALDDRAQRHTGTDPKHRTVWRLG